MVVAFYGQRGQYGSFSNFYPARFMVGQVEYCNSEQFIMYQKAMLFGDDKTAKEILATNDPNTCKKLGRKVYPFSDEMWAIHRWELCLPGIYSKFVQNPELCQVLLSTGDNLIAEYSPYDRLWGIGMNASNPNVQNPSTWYGGNLLGRLLMEARNCLRRNVSPDMDVACLALCNP